MFSAFFSGIQQDLKIFLIPPVICAVFRAIFIFVYGSGIDISRDRQKIWHCFRYGFWWGMDFNAYVFLISMIGVSLPGAFFPMYYAMGDMIRIVGLLIYLAVLLAAFIGRMIFYRHYHDIYNHILWLGKKAEKHNLLDVFFNQDHGVLCLLSFIPYLFGNYLLAKWLLSLPGIALPLFSDFWLQYIFNTVIVLVAIVGFYFFRYGGTFKHADKPEWDTIPSIVKRDIFLARATVDDLPQLETVLKHSLQEILVHTDEEDKKLIGAVLPKGTVWDKGVPTELFLRKAKGAKIDKPRHIFLIVGESYSQMPLDDIYADFHIMDGAKRFRADQHTAVLNNFLPAGMNSRPSIVGLMTGIFDARLELNERESFWSGTVCTSLPLQIKKLGYKSIYWYGGNVTYGNFQSYAPSVGFDKVMSATEFCPDGSPMTWVGVYDHVFLEKAVELIRQIDEPTFHFVYTTSNHGPYKIKLADYGYDGDKIMPKIPEKIRHSHDKQQMLGTHWYSDQAISEFIEDIRETFPDSLIIVTGDHAACPIPLKDGIIPRNEASLREICLTSFAMYHHGIDQSILANNVIGGHMNIMPTIFELIAPKGFEYYSLFPSLLEPLDHVVSPYHWLTEEHVGLTDTSIYQSVVPSEQPLESVIEEKGKERYKSEIDGWCALSGYIVRHPELLRKAEALM